MEKLAKAVDLTTDAGYELLIDMIKEGSLKRLPTQLDMNELIEKQAYQDLTDFADEDKKMFSIATPVETYISARYAEKCASLIDSSIKDKINEACLIFDIEPIKVAKVEDTTPSFNTIFDIPMETGEGRTVPGEVSYCKTASEFSAGYGTEFETNLAARAMLFPDKEETIEKIAGLKEKIHPTKMAALIQKFDEENGADAPWIQKRVGTPEATVFEKRSSDVTIDLGDKSYTIEKLADCQNVFEGLGVDVDFDDDPYTLKIALERLPKQIKEAAARYIG